MQTPQVKPVLIRVILLSVMEFIIPPVPVVYEVKELLAELHSISVDWLSDKHAVLLPT